jgi:hypothetical protein
MTSRLPIRLAVLVALVVPAGAVTSPPAAAQWLGPYLDSQRYDNLRRHQQRLQQQRRAQPRQTDQTLTPHQRACAQRYRSYNPATDTYIPRPGVTARCRL